MSKTNPAEELFIHSKADGNSMQQDLDDLLLAKGASEVLQKHYPGHAWAVHADSNGGVITVRNFSLSGDMGFILHLKQYSSSEMDRRVMLAGGELLERFKLDRNKFSIDQYANLGVDSLGNVEFAK